MPKKFAFSDDGSRYHTLKYHNRRFWGRPVYKAVVDAGFTCPNIDGSCGVGGCVYCSGGSGYFTAPELSVREQILRETERIHAVHPEAGIIAYFQAHTNTTVRSAGCGRSTPRLWNAKFAASQSRPEPTVSTVSAQSSSPRWAFRSRWSLGSRPRMTPPRGSSTAGTISRGSQRASTPPGMPDCVSAYT